MRRSGRGGRAGRAAIFGVAILAAGCGRMGFGSDEDPLIIGDAGPDGGNMAQPDGGGDGGVRMTSIALDRESNFSTSPSSLVSYQHQTDSCTECILVVAVYLASGTAVVTGDMSANGGTMTRLAATTVGGARMEVFAAPVSVVPAAQIAVSGSLNETVSGIYIYSMTWAGGSFTTPTVYQGGAVLPAGVVANGASGSRLVEFAVADCTPGFLQEGPEQTRIGNSGAFVAPAPCDRTAVHNASTQPGGNGAVSNWSDSTDASVNAYMVSVELAP